MDLEKIVKDQLEGINFSALAGSIVEKMVRKELRDLINESVKQRVDALVFEGINSVFDEPVSTDDGWGKKESYASFRELFKKVLRERLDGNWEAKRVLEKAIKERTDALVTTEWKRVIQKAVDELTHSQLIKK